MASASIRGDWARELQYRYRKTLFGIDVLQFDFGQLGFE
jgi:hypothetical protein